MILNTSWFDWRPATKGKTGLLSMSFADQNRLILRGRLEEHAPITLVSEVTGDHYAFRFFTHNKVRSSYNTEEGWLNNNGIWYEPDPVDAKKRYINVMVRFLDE